MQQGCSGPPVGALLARASHLFNAAVGDALALEGTTLRGFLLLEAASGAARPQQVLAAQVGLDKTTMVAAVDDLVARGLVERRSDPADRRVRLVAVTERGERLRRRGREVVAATEAELLDELGERGRDELRGLLLRLLGGRLGASGTGGSCV